ncbi:MAG: leucine-rich repeat domain-containing protein [Clostridia bacterium]|nr:leucine-rich repeat domain-containing protein [Clostridia bacterium]
MKKKLFFGILMVAILTCLFAISISAATEIGGLYYDLSGTGENAKAALTSDNVNCEIENVVIPETVTYNNVTYKVTTINQNAFSGSNPKWAGNAHIKTVVIPASVTSISTHTFRNCTNLQSVTIKAKNANGISLSDANFYGCSALTSVDMSESDIITLGQYCFANCGNLTTVKFSPCLTSVGGRAFNNCNSIVALDFSNTQLDNLCGVWTCKALTKIILPSTLTTMYGNGIQDTPLETIVLPHSITTLNQNCMANNYSLYMVVFPEISSDNTTISSNLFNGATPEVVIYAGENYEAVTATGKCFAGYTVKPFSEYDPTKTYTGKNLFYGATTCSKCNGLLGEEKFNFTSFTEAMSYGKKCTHCEDIDAIRTYSAMFECRGFSVSENGDEGITISFTVNGESVRGYKSETGKDVSYGLFVGIESILGSNDILDQEGNASNGTFVATVDNDQYSILQLKICGFDSEHSESKFTFGAYVQTTKDSESTLSYLQTGTPAEDEKYYYTTYGDLINA